VNENSLENVWTWFQLPPAPQIKNVYLNMNFKLSEKTLELLKNSPINKRMRKGLDLTPRNIYLQFNRVLSLKEVDKYLNKL